MSKIIFIKKDWLSDPDFIEVIRLIKKLCRKYTIYLFDDIQNIIKSGDK